jgi:hypothetical protein
MLGSPVAGSRKISFTREDLDGIGYNERMISFALPSKHLGNLLGKFRTKVSESAALFCLLSGVPFSFPAACQSVSVEVSSFGARCDGHTDDTPAIQAAINHISAAGGGTVRFAGTCTGPYYLNSFTRADPFWTYNLLLPSNVTLQGQPGAKLLQGPRGTSQIYMQRTAAIGVGPHPACFSSSPCNGGWYALKPFLRNDPQITLAAAVNASRFRAGDTVFVAASTRVINGGVLTGEPNIVAAVDSNTAELQMKYPLSRSFSSPLVANTSALTTHNITIKNLIIQAWCPLAIYNTFDIDIENNTFISDQTNRLGAYNLDIGTVRQFLFKNNVMNAATSAGREIPGMQMPMQDSYDLTWDSNTFYATGWNFGSEYTAHEKIINNHIWISRAERSGASPGIVMGGQDILFSHNDVHGGISNRNGIPVLLADYYAGSATYADYTGELRIEDNTIECTSPVLTYCLYLQIPGTVVSGNHITATGTTHGIIILKPPRGTSNNITVTHNTIAVEQGVGVVVRPSPIPSAVVRDNQITGMGPECIRVASSAGDQGEDTLSGNMNTGCQIPVLTDTPPVR